MSIATQCVAPPCRPGAKGVVRSLKADHRISCRESSSILRVVLLKRGWLGWVHEFLMNYLPRPAVFANVSTFGVYFGGPSAATGIAVRTKICVSVGA